MLPIVWVLLIAAESVYGAATVTVAQSFARDAAPPVNVVDRAFELVDGGDTNVYILTAQQILTDLANQPDISSQSIAVGSTIAVLGELGSGSSGDACAYANAVNAYVGYLGSGNSGGLRNAVGGVVGRLSGAIDSISALASNPGALRFSRGASGGCAGGGRSYQFESAWESVLGSAGINNAGLLNELYCASRRLYNAFNDRSNNVGAAASAAALPPVANIVGGALGALTNFLNAAAGGNPAAIASAAAAAKAALTNSLANVRL